MSKDEKDLKEFLKKVDDVGSIIKELNAADEKTTEHVLNKANNYLRKTGEQPSSGFNKTLINKIEDEVSSVEPRQEISAEDFKKEVENDIEQRAIKKKKNKEKSLVWKSKGNNWFKEEHFSDAVNCYSEAIKLTPDEVIFYCNRAQALIKLQKYDDALKDCENGIKLDKRFVKIYVHQGRALTGLKKYEKAIASFNHVLKIDKKQQNVITEYINEVEKEKQLYLEEQKTSALLEGGDKELHEIKTCVSTLRKGSPPDIWKANEVIVKLKELILEENQRTVFRTSRGFNIFTEHPALNKLMNKTLFSPEELKVVVNIVGLLSNALKDCEKNCNIMCAMSFILNTTIECLKSGNGLKEEFEVILLFHRISQFDVSRKILLANPCISHLLNQTLAILGKGGDLALIAMGMINNLALDPSFVPQFEGKLSTDFIPGVIKMMELLSLSFPDIALTKTFLPVMASSISTIANLFHNANLRKKRADADENMWTASLQLLTKYSTELDDKSILKVVQATLGMLMNLSTQQITFEHGFSRKWVTLSVELILSKYPVIVERCCGIMNHTLGCNDAMLKEIIDKKIYLHFINIIKGDNEAAKRYTIKCIALCANVDEGVQQSISSRKVIPYLLKCLDSNDELIIGNTALIFVHCHGNRSIVLEVIGCGLIKKFLIHARNDQLSKTVRHNCAIAIGKYCLADSECLQQLRDLHGLEILHEVMKENKLV